MGRFVEWTTFEIEQMKIAFLQGKTIKVMAEQLGRTPTALNKALSRFGVRQSNLKPVKVPAPCIDWRRYLVPENAPTSIDDDPILIPPTPKVKSSFLMNRDFLRATDPRWVTLEKVIHYLERQGHRVKTNDAALDDYQVDGKPVKASYLLLLANRLRIEESKPIFMVSEVTW